MGSVRDIRGSASWLEVICGDRVSVATKIQGKGLVCPVQHEVRSVVRSFQWRAVTVVFDEDMGAGVKSRWDGVWRGTMMVGKASKRGVHRG